MDYKLLIIIAAAAIILHHFWQEIGTLREFVDNLKLRVKELETTAIPVKSIHVPVIATADGSPILRPVQQSLPVKAKVQEPAPSIDNQIDQASADPRFAKMAELLKRYETEYPIRQQVNNIVQKSIRTVPEDIDEPSFDVPADAVWQNPEINEVTASPVSSADNPISSQILRIENFMAEASETIMSYGDSAVTIKSWPNARNTANMLNTETSPNALLMVAAAELKSAINDKELNTDRIISNKNLQVDSPAGSETISLDLTTNSGRLRMVPKIKTPSLHISSDEDSVPNERLSKAIDQLNKMINNRIELEIDSSCSDERGSTIRSSPRSSRTGGVVKNNIQQRVYERQ